MWESAAKSQIFACSGLDRSLLSSNDNSCLMDFGPKDTVLELVFGKACFTTIHTTALLSAEDLFMELILLVA